MVGSCCCGGEAAAAAVAGPLTRDRPRNESRGPCRTSLSEIASGDGISLSPGLRTTSMVGMSASTGTPAVRPLLPSELCCAELGRSARRAMGLDPPSRSVAISTVVIEGSTAISPAPAPAISTVVIDGACTCRKTGPPARKV